MMTVRRAFGTVLLGTSMAVALLAQASPMLNVKLGLWEMTSTIDMSGMMGGIDLSKLPADQRAAIEGMMRGRGGTPTVTKTCMTKEKLSTAAFGQDRPNEKCVPKFTKSSSTVLDVTETCTSDDQPPSTSTSQMHIEATSPTTVAMTGKTTDTRGGRGPQTVSFSITGKWVSTDCGDVK